MYGVFLAFAAAVLFGASIPASRLLLQSFDPLQLAGLLYLGAAAAMLPVVSAERRRFGRVTLDHANRVRVIGVVILGGMVAPILLLAAFRFSTAGTIALLLNCESLRPPYSASRSFTNTWGAVRGVVSPA